MVAAAIFLLALFAGAIAAVAGFGIGSVLTPAMALAVDIKLAVAAAAIPHFLGTALRCWTLRAHIDRTLFWRFGLMSAAGALGGALLGSRLRSPTLTLVCGLLLVFVAASHLTGFAARMRFHGANAWTAGALSGFFGGLVGNQGGLRSAALLGFDLRRDRFVATTTAIGLAVDGARIPVYLAEQHRALGAMLPLIALGTVGVLAGTLAGSRLLARLPESGFRRAVAVLLLALGASLIMRAR